MKIKDLQNIKPRTVIFFKKDGNSEMAGYFVRFTRTNKVVMDVYWLDGTKTKVTVSPRNIFGVER